MTTDFPTTLPQLAERGAGPATTRRRALHTRGIYPTGASTRTAPLSPRVDEVRGAGDLDGDSGTGRIIDSVSGVDEHESGALNDRRRLDLPTDPAALEDILKSQGLEPAAQGHAVFRHGTALSVQVVDPSAQAALLLLLASKQAHVAGPTIDRLGLPGLAVTVTETG